MASTLNETQIKFVWDNASFQRTQTEKTPWRTEIIQPYKNTSQLSFLWQSSKQNLPTSRPRHQVKQNSVADAPIILWTICGATTTYERPFKDWDCLEFWSVVQGSANQLGFHADGQNHAKTYLSGHLNNRHHRWSQPTWLEMRPTNERGRQGILRPDGTSTRPRLLPRYVGSLILWENWLWTYVDKEIEESRCQYGIQDGMDVWKEILI